MNKQNYSATIVVKQAPEMAFNAIKNFRNWWSQDIEGSTDVLNETFFYHYKDVHLCKLQLIEIVPTKKLVYLVTENYFGFTKNQEEWVGTKLIFELTAEDNGTKIQFTHEGLLPGHKCYKICEDAWNGYITRSLFNLIANGKGVPNPIVKEGFDVEMVERWAMG